MNSYSMLAKIARYTLILLLAACGGKGGDAVEVGEVHVVISLLKGNGKISFAPAPAVVNSLQIHVTGEGMAQPVTKLFVRGTDFNDVTQPVSAMLRVPTGANRTFVVKAFDTPNGMGNILFQGSTTHVSVVLDGNNVDIALLPLPLPTPAGLRIPQTLEITPANASIAIGTTQSFTATGRFSDGTIQDLTTSVQWRSLATQTATINARGVATGIGAGSTAITATLGPITGVTILVVVPLPSTPLLSVTADIKQLRFRWTESIGAASYKLMENPDGLSGFTPIQSDIRAATTVTVKEIAAHKHDFANARYLVSACNVAGCTDSNEVHTQAAALSAIGYFKAINTEAGDEFGSSVAVSGDGQTLVVGAPLEDGMATSTGVVGEAGNGASDAGAVYIFAKSGAGWSQQAYVKAANADIGDQFGFSIAISEDGNTLAVGAPLEDSAAIGINDNQADNGVSNSGAVYIFTRSGATWSHQAYLKASNTRKKDKFGHVLSLSNDGNTLAVGAPSENSAATGINGNMADDRASDAGAVYIFTRSHATWSQQAYVKASNTEAGDEFGQSVSLSGDGNTLAVGASLEDGTATSTGLTGQAENDARDSGAVYIFIRSGITWSQLAYVKASNAEAKDRFGQSVSLNGAGNTLAVGAQGEDSAVAGLHGNQADNGASDAGAVYIFTQSGAAWSQLAYVKASNTEAGDSFGQFVALSRDGNTLAVGASLEDSATTVTGITAVDNLASDAGAVYIFTQSNARWSQRTYVKAANTESKDKFGAVSLSSDGNTLAVGAFSEDSAATGIGGNRADNSASGAGAVYLY